MDKYQQTVPLATLDKIKDIGVYFDAKLDFKDYMHEKINKAYMMLRLINRNFKHMSIPTLVALYTRSPASAGIANRPLVFLGIFLIFVLG